MTEMETDLPVWEISAAHGTATILSVSPHESDHFSLATIVEDAPAAGEPVQWSLRRSRSVASALAVLEKDSVPVVLCESELGKESWRDLLDAVSRLPQPPMLVVTSRLADNYLWAEALNLGAYDVLAKPFYSEEVMRTLRSACQRYQESQKATIKAKKARIRSTPAPLVFGSAS